MRNIEGNKWIPSDGFKYISNGETWAESINIGQSDNIANWHDTNEEPPEPEEEVDDAEALQILLGGAT